jgi:excisionase family DNA binding protein
MTDKDIMTPAEVAKIFRVKAPTVTRWAATGKLPSFQTLGGHRRFHREAVLALLGKGEYSLESES